MNIFRKITNWVRRRTYYVIADPDDNSVTLSKALFHHIKTHARESDAAKVYVFRLCDGDKPQANYGFTVNPDIEQPTQLCDIQYNSKYRCIGFETLCPSVARIFYDYGLPVSTAVKLSVSVRPTHGKTIYEIHRPHPHAKPPRT